MLVDDFADEVDKANLIPIKSDKILDAEVDAIKESLDSEVKDGRILKYEITKVDYENFSVDVSVQFNKMVSFIHTDLKV